MSAIDNVIGWAKKERHQGVREEAQGAEAELSALRTDLASKEAKMLQMDEDATRKLDRWQEMYRKSQAQIKQTERVGEKVAAHIDTLEAQNKALREALEKLVAATRQQETWSEGVVDALRVADAALQPTKGEG